MAKPADPATTPPSNGTNVTPPAGNSNPSATPTPPADRSQADEQTASAAAGANNEEANHEPEEQASEQPDPATTPDAESVALKDIQVNDRVLYPDDSSENGWRYGRVLEVFDSTVELVYRDGSTRTFSKSRLRTKVPV